MISFLFHYGQTKVLVWYAAPCDHEDELLGVIVKGPGRAVFETSQVAPGHSFEDMQFSASTTLCMLNLALEDEDVDEFIRGTSLDRLEAIRVFNAALQFGSLLEEASTIAIDETAKIGKRW